ncbi:hypothetical protein BH11VER1_BH11VER1_00130 [soil metagenome]
MSYNLWNEPELRWDGDFYDTRMGVRKLNRVFCTKMQIIRFSLELLPT